MITAQQEAAGTPSRSNPRAPIAALLDRVTARIAPTWPLDRFIAVNPLWGFVDEPLPKVATRLSSLSGAKLVMQRAYFRQALREGRITHAQLEEAIVRTRSDQTLRELESAIQSAEPTRPRCSTIADVVDSRRDLAHEVPWSDYITNDISQLCASYFDRTQASLQPDRRDGLYASWRRQALAHRGPGLLMGFRSYRERVAELPDTPVGLIEGALELLDVDPSEAESYLTMLLLGINGWAAYCAYLRWTARLSERDDDHLVQLLAMRLAWEWLMFREGGAPLRTDWRRAKAQWSVAEFEARSTQSVDWTLQRALEVAYQQTVAAGLVAEKQDTQQPARRPAVQAAFCIDVRSEVIRRALEREDDSLQTLGFAGFFGAPIEYMPAGASAARPQLPGLLAPRFRASDAGIAESAVRRRASQSALTEAWRAFQTGAGSSLSFVESAGLLYVGKLLGDTFKRTRAKSPERSNLTKSEDRARRPRLTGHVSGAPLTVADRVDLAAGILRAMSLTTNHARLVLLVGHGGESVNNPHAASLDCGACCGHTGEVNARVVAALLNEPDVRQGLDERGVRIPADTRFIAGLHNTTTDEIELFELDEVREEHAADLARLQRVLERASDRARAERAARLGLAERPASLREALSRRARDWSEVRPEWGLADNASFIVAPRERTRHLDLDGRAFLHDYCWKKDADFSVLELIMTAPMMVTHWINMQYYASTVDNARYGSGNKVLHNVVGGHIGVFEGNGGDLRIGLPLQSLHDGQRWMHTPVRLSVFIEAPREAIDRVLAKHSRVRELVDNEWLFLFQLDADHRTVHLRERGGWITHLAAQASDSSGQS